jgi:hypothetical protein
MAALLSAHSHLQGTLLDRASAIALSGEVLRAHNVTHRCQCVADDCERTREEFRKLLEVSGFCLQRIIRTAADISVIEAIAE